MLEQWQPHDLRVLLTDLWELRGDDLFGNKTLGAPNHGLCAISEVDNGTCAEKTEHLTPPAEADAGPVDSRRGLLLRFVPEYRGLRAHQCKIEKYKHN